MLHIKSNLLKRCVLWIKRIFWNRLNKSFFSFTCHLFHFIFIDLAGRSRMINSFENFTIFFIFIRCIIALFLKFNLLIYWRKMYSFIKFTNLNLFLWRRTIIRQFISKSLLIIWQFSSINFLMFFQIPWTNITARRFIIFYLPSILFFVTLRW